MAHVQITQESARGPLKVVIDGVDVSHDIYDDGFALMRVGDDPCTAEWGVRLIVAADVLDIDLPEAVVEAVAKSDDEVKTMQEARA